MRIFTSRSFGDTGGSFGLPWREGLPIQVPALRPGIGTENVYEMHGCCTGPFEAPGHSCTELSGRLAHSGSLQGASESSQGYRSLPHPFSWPQDERLGLLHMRPFLWWMKELRLHPTVPATRLIRVRSCCRPIFSGAGWEWVRSTVAIWSRRTYQWQAGALSSKADRRAGSGRKSSSLGI